jgi:hypothetical protein
MAADDVVESERRGLERRVEMLERELRELEKAAAVMQATLNGLVSTMDSRHKAFEAGQALILKSLDTVEKAQIKQENDLKMIAAAPQDLSKVVFSPKVVIAIISGVLTIVAGQMASTWGMRSDIRDFGTRQTMQATIDEKTLKLREERDAAFKQSVDDIKKQQQLGQLEIQNLRETVLNQRRSP